MLKHDIGEYRIEYFDINNYTVSVKYEKNDGSVSYKIIAYSSTLKFAMRRVAKECADHKESISEWLSEYQATIDKLMEEI